MDLKRIFSGRVVGLIVFILAVLLLGAMFNVKLEGMEEGNVAVTPVASKKEEQNEMLPAMQKDGMENMLGQFFGGNAKATSGTVSAK